MRKPKFKVGQWVVVSRLEAVIIRKEKYVWWVAVAGYEFPVYPDEIKRRKVK